MKLNNRTFFLICIHYTVFCITWQPEWWFQIKYVKLTSIFIINGTKDSDEHKCYTQKKAVHSIYQSIENKQKQPLKGKHTKKLHCQESFQEFENQLTWHNQLQTPENSAKPRKFSYKNHEIMIHAEKFYKISGKILQNNL